MPCRSYSLRARPPTGDPGPAERVRDPDVLASHLDDAAHFSGGHAAELFAPSSEAEVAARAARVRRGPADRRAVVADRRSDADGRDAPQHGAAESHRVHRSDRVRVQAGVTLAALDDALRQRGPGLSAGADVHGRLRRRNGRDQRRRSRDIQVRHDPRLGLRADRRPANGRRAGHRARRDARAARTDTSSCALADRTIASRRSRVPHARTCRSCRPATSPRQTWI